MKPIQYASFAAAIQQAAYYLKSRSSLVHSAKWQGSDIANRPEMATHEVSHVSFCVDMKPVGVSRAPTKEEWLELLGNDIQPNLPWADDHFEERVCGYPINPGKEWKAWPYGKSAATFLGMTRTRSPQDWAYLAAMVDADGSFSLRTCNGDKAYPRIKITQVDESFLRSLYELWQVGTLRPYSAENNKLSDRQSWIWRVSSKGEVRWLLEGMMPFLRLKKARALELLEYVNNSEMPTEEIFNHNYMERYYPKSAGHSSSTHRGIRYEYGDLNDVVALLAGDPYTRQAYLPIWFPEDTGGGSKRAPCTIGYHFLMRDGKLDINYHIRSCDFVRHFRDDLYLTARLLLWVIERAAAIDERWTSVVPGKFVMQIGSLHIFRNDYRMLFGDE